MNTVSSNIRPNAIERLGNNTYYYNYNSTRNGYGYRPVIEYRDI